MRIIAGTARSLPLKTPEGLETRPTSDKIKETLFNMLQTEICGSTFLDLFAGSGQIGLEALSRGAAYAVFADNSKKAVKCIAENIAFTKFTDRAKLFPADVIGALAMMEGAYTFDIVFMDPPYNTGLEKEVLSYLSRSALITGESTVIVEASLETGFSDVEALGFTVVKYKKYKTNAHVFLRRNEAV